jgi:uncharacterized protein (TIGR03066 family)
MRIQVSLTGAILLVTSVAIGQDSPFQGGFPPPAAAKKVPDKLVGKWVVKGGEQDGATFDFHSDGTMIGRINVGGKEGIIKARVRVEVNKLFSVTGNPNTGKDDTRTLIIKSLTARQVILQDERRQVLTLERVQK